MPKLAIKTNKTAERLTVQLSGSVDEDTDFTTCSLVNQQIIDLDLQGIKSINSCGIREWIKWVDTSAKDSTITLFNCPKVIVDQINMVDGFLPNNAKVDSFFVPYYNEGTGEEKNVLFRFGVEFKDMSMTPPEVVKDAEGNVMEMDVIETKYFKFLKKSA